jgi:hypothetical protein
MNVSPESNELHDLIKHGVQFLAKSAPVVTLLAIASAAKSILAHGHLAWWKQVCLTFFSFVVGICVLKLTTDAKWAIAGALVWDNVVKIMLSIAQDKKVGESVKGVFIGWVRKAK